MRALTSLLIGLIALCLSPSMSVAQDAPPEPLSLGYQGFVTDLSGQPVDGLRSLTFHMYHASRDGRPVWEETLEQVELSGGHFVVSVRLKSAS